MTILTMTIILQTNFFRDEREPKSSRISISSGTSYDQNILPKENKVKQDCSFSVYKVKNCNVPPKNMSIIVVTNEEILFQNNVNNLKNSTYKVPLQTVMVIYISIIVQKIQTMSQVAATNSKKVWRIFVESIFSPKCPI